MRVSEFIEKLKTLPQDKSILCQVVGTEGNGAWNMQFDIVDIPEMSWAVQLRVSHPDLKALPDINFGGGKEYKG